MRRFEYFAPESVDEAVSLLRERGDGVKLLAGGTDLLVQMKEAGLHPPAIVSLHLIPDLRGIAEDDGLRIGSGTEMVEVAAHDVVRDRYTALAEGAGIVGSVQTRNMATIGGNIANAAPSADTAPPLAVFDAEAEITGPNGSRRLPVAEMFDGPGSTVLASDEVLVALHLPAQPARTGSVYQRHTPRKTMDIAAVGVAVKLSLADNGEVIESARICLGAVGPTIIRAEQAEQALTGQPPSDELFDNAAALAQAAASPISDVRGSAEFRRYLVGVMTRRCLKIAHERAKAT
ncbi:MAG: xanthine dehydrogenase family protein subunit M [Chloroflexi bacterium]|nr:xanthine dehydrogenase family protein subunit M [Chloroflexota bacterium]